MLTTTAVKSTAMLLLVALATVNADLAEEHKTPCQTMEINDYTVEYCCPCASTIFGGACLSTSKGTCDRFNLRQGITRCRRGQWPCFQVRHDLKAKADALINETIQGGVPNAADDLESTSLELAPDDHLPLA